MSRINEIVEYNPVIYPTRIWVCIRPSYEQVHDMFYALTDNTERADITPEWFETDRFTIATTVPVSSKTSGWIGIFIAIWKPSKLDINTICHESSHAADYLCNQFGISNGDFEHGEARAYFQGWIADCIYKTKVGK